MTSATTLQHVSVGQEFVASGSMDLCRLPPGCFFRACPQGSCVPTDFGIYSRNEINSTAAYTADGRDGYKSLSGKVLERLRWDGDTMAPEPDDPRMVHVELHSGVENCSLHQFGWMFLSDLSLRSAAESASDVQSRIAAANRARVADAETSVLGHREYLKRMEDDFRREEEWQLRKLAELRAAYAEQVAEAQAALRGAEAKVAELRGSSRGAHSSKHGR